ncbi:MAG: alanine dehydrogenase, partial [Bacteroidales bacterium]|nr:alanine dehydrogenase [Bacteroidales bacterium]
LHMVANEQNIPNFPISSQLLPKEEMLESTPKKASLNIAILKENNDTERRVCLSPEAVGVLVQNGHHVFVENGAGLASHYEDLHYSQEGATLLKTKEELLKADIILKVSALDSQEIKCLGRNQTLLTTLQVLLRDKHYFTHLSERKVTGLAFEKIKDNTGTYPIIRSMGEIVGNSSLHIAAKYLAHHKYGNGSMLGGVPGLKPTEVVIIGAGTVSENAAKAAIGMGATVKVFDNSVYRLRRLQNNIQNKIFTSVLETKILEETLQTADVVLGAMRKRKGMASYLVPSYMIQKMKKGAVIIDVSIDQGGLFETSRLTSHSQPVYQEFGVTHYCVPNIASGVPRTASKALSNFFMPIILQIAEEGGVSQLLRTDLGFRSGVYMYNGVITDKVIGEMFNMSYRDLELLLAILH